jgi:hypothetical protein
MAEAVEPVGSDSAEKAYAAAAEIAVAKADAPAAVAAPAAVSAPAPAPALAFPAKPERASAAEQAPKPVVAMVAKPVADPVIPAKPAAVAAKMPVAAKKAVSANKAVVAKALKPAAAKPVKAAPPKFKSATNSTPIVKIKETIMATKQTKDFTNTVKTVAADVQAKAKLALAKGSEVLGEASTFTKGNVEAIVASGKILGAGLQDLGKTYAAESKSAYETVTADVKELAAVKSPVDFVRLQTSILRRNFDHAFDFGGKNSETVLKLAGEAFAPISARASLAIAKVKKAA